MTSPQPAKRACDPSPQPQQYARNRVVEIKCWARFENRTAARPSTQIDIQPPQRVDGDAVAAVDQHSRGFGLDDRRSGQGMAGLELVERLDRTHAQAAKKALPLAARRAGGRRIDRGDI